ncbi:cobalamin-binding protein [Echinimonas agarilytica]|uniref:Cobalamin-binding protein n=1 Tax=Echinimonas agarilytica TaxID=1215918 RepID=A0AA41W8F7_9GAMM|nr:cobalamin-binding protein [Echinimonas agarilytica]MCM2681147.1 cobalamin-binding protein [Echinimonas agarilytica]
MRALVLGIVLCCSVVFTFANEQQPKVVVLAPHVVEMLYTIGAGDQILATTEHSDFPEEALAIPRVGNYVRLQIETILELQPDYVIVWRNGNPPDDLARLERLGLNIVDSHPIQLSDVASELRKFGQLLGHQARAEQQALAFEHKLQSIRERYQSTTKLRVFYELWPQPLTTVSRGSWPQQILDLCHVDNVLIDTKGEYPNVSLETVVALSPSVIIQPHDSARNIPATDWSKWPVIPAVKKNNILHPNADRLHRMTTRMLDEASLLCEALDQLR